MNLYLPRKLQTHFYFVSNLIKNIIQEAGIETERNKDGMFPPKGWLPNAHMGIWLDQATGGSRELSQGPTRVFWNLFSVTIIASRGVLTGAWAEEPELGTQLFTPLWAAGVLTAEQ